MQKTSELPTPFPRLPEERKKMAHLTKVDDEAELRMRMCSSRSADTMTTSTE